MIPVILDVRKEEFSHTLGLGLWVHLELKITQFCHTTTAGRQKQVLECRQHLHACKPPHSVLKTEATHTPRLEADMRIWGLEICNWLCLVLNTFQCSVDFEKGKASDPLSRRFIILERRRGKNHSLLLRQELHAIIGSTSSRCIWSDFYTFKIRLISFLRAHSPALGTHFKFRATHSSWNTGSILRKIHPTSLRLLPLSYNQE